MAGVYALAYAMGSVIRFNIHRVEPLIEAGTATAQVGRYERTANLARVLAYAISVCLYIHILADFVLGALGVNTPFRENILTVLIVAGIGVLGRFRGLDMLLVLERWALGVTVMYLLRDGEQTLYAVRGLRLAAIRALPLPLTNALAITRTCHPCQWRTRRDARRVASEPAVLRVPAVNAIIILLTTESCLR